MTSEQSRRVSRSYRWGIGSCLALAMAAGTAMGQQQEQPEQQKETVRVTGEDLKVQKLDQEKNKAHDKQDGMGAIYGTGEPQDKKDKKGDWKSAQSLPINKDLVLAGKTTDDRDVHLVYTGGRLQSARLDDQNIQRDRIKFKQHDGKSKVCILKEDGKDELIAFEIPQQVLATGQDRFEMDRDSGQQRFGSMEQNWDQDRWHRENNLQHEREGAGIDYWQNRNWDVHQFEDRRGMSPDQNWDRNRDWDGGQNWDARSDQRSNMRFERNQPQFETRREFDMRDDRMYRTEAYGPSRFESQREFRGDMYDSRSTQRMEMRSPERFESRPTFRSDDPQAYRQTYRTETRMYTTSERPTLGVQLRDLNNQELRSITREHQQGLRVQRVQRGGMADRAGLRPGDVIVRIDGRPAHSNLLRDALSDKARMGEDLRLTVIRNDQTRTIAISPGMGSQRFATGEFIPEQPSSLEHFELPNIQHPGYSSYSPSGDMYSGDRRIRSTDRDYRYDVDRNRDVEMRYDRNINRTRDFDTRYNREFDVRFDRDVNHDRNMRVQQRWDTNYDGGEVPYDAWDQDDVRMQNWDTGVDYERPNIDARGTTSRNRIFGTTEADTFDSTVYDRDVVIRDRDVRTPGRESYLDIEMPNVQHPGPYNHYRPTLPQQGPRR